MKEFEGQILAKGRTLVHHISDVIESTLADTSLTGATSDDSIVGAAACSALLLVFMRQLDASARRRVEELATELCWDIEVAVRR